MATLSRTVGFWLVAATSVTVLFGAAAPSPLYPVYRQLWGFSALTLTAIFAVYVLALLATLLTVGSLSDHVGRKPVLAASVVVLIASMIAFGTADGVGVLVLARVLQGLATGAVMGALSATLVDLQPRPGLGSTMGSVTPAFGLAAGAVSAGALVQYAPDPRVLVYVVTGAALMLVLAFAVFLPESSPRTRFRSGTDLRRSLAPRVSLPPSSRSAFLVGVPAMIATWSLAGLYLSLGSSIAAVTLGIANHAVVGAILATFFAAGSVGSALAGIAADPARLRWGYALLSSGVLVTLIGTTTASTPTYVAGSALAGAGFGAVFVGVMASLAAVTAPAERGRVFSAVYVVSYAAFSLPALVAGLTTQAYGLRDTAIGYAGVVLALTLLAATLAVTRERRMSRVATTCEAEALT